MKGIKIMGLDSYIFNTTKKDELAKMREIKQTQIEGRSKAITIGEMMIFFDGDANYMDKLDYEVFWRKSGYVTAWILTKVFNNNVESIEKAIGVVTKDDLRKLRNDCRAVIEHCTKNDGTIVINEEYCEKMFPPLKIAFSGCTGYDEYFIYELKKASEDIARLFLTCNEPDTSFISFADF